MNCLTLFNYKPNWLNCSRLINPGAVGIYETGELDKNAVVAIFATTAKSATTNDLKKKEVKM